VPLLVALFVFLPQVITEVYGRADYLPAINVARLFLGYMIMKLLSNPFAVLYSTLERPEFSLYSQVFAVLNLILLFVLVPGYGIMGAAAATCGVAPLYLIYHWVIMRYVIGIRITVPWRAFLRTTGNLVLPTVVAVKLQGHLSGIPGTMGGFVLFGVIYLGLFSLSNIFDERERITIRKTMGKWAFFF
jgi:O-antigen/teichoic acid export membrane protein